ncbi:MAG TPA: septum formation initiator family protein [Steroidobacteraceae bacterium]|nr:septum formation initiator family protein [Steroidobacteraceae bacterium]
MAAILLQYRLWVSGQGMREIMRLRTDIAAQTTANQAQSEHNRRLAAEVQDLKVGRGALEERARSELGMIGANETFYEVVPANTPAPPAHDITARNE